MSGRKHGRRAWLMEIGERVQEHERIERWRRGYDEVPGMTPHKKPQHGCLDSCSGASLFIVNQQEEE